MERLQVLQKVQIVKRTGTGSVVRVKGAQPAEAAVAAGMVAEAEAMEAVTEEDNLKKKYSGEINSLIKNAVSNSDNYHQAF
jgi:hypothetical protein